MRQLRVPAGLKPRRMPLRHQSVTVRCGICRIAATCSGVRTSVGGFMRRTIFDYRFTVKYLEVHVSRYICATTSGKEMALWP